MAWRFTCHVGESSSKYLKDPKAKDALKEATKEAAKKRKKEMQTEEDGKTSSFESEVKANLIELDLLLDSLILQSTIWSFLKAAAASSKKGKEAGQQIAQLAKFHLQESSQVWCH